MYTLLHGFYKYMVEKDEYCVLILGLDDAGKTVSFLKWCNSHQWCAKIQDFLWIWLDLFGGGENETHQKLQRTQSKAYNNNSWSEHWSNRYIWNSFKFLGFGRPTRATIIMGQILSRITCNHLCCWFTWSRTNGRIESCFRFVGILKSF